MADIDVGSEIMAALTYYTNDIKESVDEAVISTANELDFMPGGVNSPVRAWKSVGSNDP